MTFFLFDSIQNRLEKGSKALVNVNNAERESLQW